MKNPMTENGNESSESTQRAHASRFDIGRKPHGDLMSDSSILGEKPYNLGLEAIGRRPGFSVFRQMHAVFGQRDSPRRSIGNIRSR